MNDLPLTQNADYLRDQQYRGAGNLNARVVLHQRFSTNPIGLQPFIFDLLKLQSGARVLECGCGPGWLWRENLARIPDGCAVTLTDFSPWMVAEAEAALAAAGPDFQFRTADIQSLPFDSASFDVVIANHMLYHVPDLARALKEVRRVLAPSGRFFAATNGLDHMAELDNLAVQLFPPEVSEGLRLQRAQIGGAFGLENGESLLSPWFSDVSLRIYEDGLLVTESEPLVAYVASLMSAVDLMSQERAEKLKRLVESEIAEMGSFTITKATGIFEAFGAAG